jgi:hypothetical protein
MSQDTVVRILRAPSRTDHRVGVVKVATARNDRRRRNARLHKAAKDYNAAIHAAAVVHDEALAEAGATLGTAFDEAAAAYNEALMPLPHEAVSATQTCDTRRPRAAPNLVEGK